MFATGLPWFVAVPLAILFTAILAGYIVWASTKSDASSRTDEYE